MKKGFPESEKRSLFERTQGQVLQSRITCALDKPVITCVFAAAADADFIPLPQATPQALRIECRTPSYADPRRTLDQAIVYIMYGHGSITLGNIQFSYNVTYATKSPEVAEVRYK